VKVAGAAGIDARTIWKVEARDISIKNRDQLTIGQSITIDFRTGVTNRNGHVVAVQGPNVLKGEHLFLGLKAGTSRLEGPECRRVY